MTKRLEDFNLENRKPRSSNASHAVLMQFENNEATKRVVMYSAKHVIKRHKKEIQVNRLHFTTLLYCLIMRQ